jgi:uncharacterized membrane protein YjjP (DUF1212 family)
MSMENGERNENALEPVELIKQSGAVLRVGRAMLTSGTGSYRVKTAMDQVAQSFGLDRHEAHVTLTEITGTSYRGPIFRTEVAEVHSMGVNSNKIKMLTELVNGLRPGSTPEQVNAAVDQIDATPPLYPGWANAAFAGVACGAFSYLNNGRAFEIAAVTVAAALGQYVRRIFLHRRFNQFAAAMVAAAVACLAYLGIILAVQAVGSGAQSHEAGYISAVLFLVPGFPLVTGALDLAKLDFSAGVARTAYALMVLISAGLSVWAVSWLVGLSPDAIPPADLPYLVTLGLRMVASWFGVLGFALMFNSPWRMAIGAATIGMVANVLRLELAGTGVAIQAATMLATLVVGLLAARVAPALKVPRITVSVPAVVIMVPGAAAYRAVLGLNNGDVQTAVTSGATAVFVVISIAVGLAAGRILTDRAWAYERG